MASSIASPVPRALPKSIQTVQSDDDGRTTPLPQYEKNPQAVPFTIELQEEKDNPGQFQLVVNVGTKQQTTASGSPLAPVTSKKLVASLKEFPSLGYDVSPLYRPLKSSPPMSPGEERQGWSDLDGVTPEFLEKVVPDWKVDFSRSDTVASTQSKKLAEIKARIKKTGKGFVVRLLKGSNTEAETNEVAEVHLGQNVKESDEGIQDLQSSAVELPANTEPVELDASVTTSSATTAVKQNAICELQPRSFVNNGSTIAHAPISSVPRWLQQAPESSRRTSVLEEGWLSDAETLRSDIPSLTNRMEDFSDIEPQLGNSSTIPTRSASLFSIVKTPTRGLSVVGQVRRVEKGRPRGQGKAARSALNRSGAQKSLRRNSPRTSTQDIPLLSFPGGHGSKPSNTHDASYYPEPPDMSSDESSANENNTWPHTIRERHNTKLHRSSSADRPSQSITSKARLRLETDVPRATSANSSPNTRRKRGLGKKKSTAFSSGVDIADSSQSAQLSPSDELRKAISEAFGGIEDKEQVKHHDPESLSIPRIEEPENPDAMGEMLLVPADYETRYPPPAVSSPMMKFWGLVFSALSEKAFEGLSALRNRYGSEPEVPPGHVRVRWTCSCGEQLYDDFIEQRPGAARWLEIFLNRPVAHTPNSPSSSRASTVSSVNSIFDSHSRASTLTTPSSTYNGTSSWGQSGSSSKYSPTRLRSNNPFSVRIDVPIEESWLLTCANEGRLTPKVVHLDVNSTKIKSDKDLALALREHYESLNRRWLRWARLRGLSTIQFVQFEVHRNRFADIRSTPSLPPTSSTANKPSSPSHHPYKFEPVDLLPPVGSTYLLHLFQHPSDYDNELITYLRAPKRTSRLQFGMGWGVYMVEGFMAQKVWGLVLAGFGLGSAVFAVCWAVGTGDVQSAFGVASWVVTVAGLVVAGAQAWID